MASGELVCLATINLGSSLEMTTSAFGAVRIQGCDFGNACVILLSQRVGGASTDFAFQRVTRTGQITVYLVDSPTVAPIFSVTIPVFFARVVSYGSHGANMFIRMSRATQIPPANAIQIVLLHTGRTQASSYPEIPISRNGDLISPKCVGMPGNVRRVSHA